MALRNDHITVTILLTEPNNILVGWWRRLHFPSIFMLYLDIFYFCRNIPISLIEMVIFKFHQNNWLDFPYTCLI